MPDNFAAPTESSVRAEHPPRPPLALRVGVVGHRPDPEKRPDTPDEKALREICRQLLQHIQDIFVGVLSAHRDLFAAPSPHPDGKPPGLRLITALAAGADQWVAAEAEQLGYKLQAVLPFGRDEYEKDFTDPATLDEHRRLRDLATAVFELDGDREREGESYLAAGRVLLNQSDLLIALWDGKDQQGIGGSGQIVQDALQHGIPTLWVNWDAPEDWRLMQPAWRLLQQPSDKQGEFHLLTEQVTDLLLPPSLHRTNSTLAEDDLRETYFSECFQSCTLLGGWWSFFLALLQGKPKPLAVHGPEPLATIQQEWQHDWEGSEAKPRTHKLPVAIVTWVEHNCLPHYTWADQLSTHYANLYRSSFLWVYLLGALAVVLALLGMAIGASPEGKQAFLVLEMSIIGGISALTWYGRRQRWHERWIDYRTLAERLRSVRFNALLGGAWHRTNVPSHLATYGNPAATWMHWYARAVERHAGIPNVVVNEEYLLSCKELLQDALIGGQAQYHKRNVARLEPVDHRLHRLGEWLFIATFFVCLVHFFFHLWGHWLTFCAAVFPALGAALAAIRSQGEFHRLVQRSRAMSEELAHLRQSVANVPTRPNELHSRRLQQVIEQTTRQMYNEGLDWRIVFQDRPLVLPA